MLGQKEFSLKKMRAMVFDIFFLNKKSGNFFFTPDFNYLHQDSMKNRYFKQRQFFHLFLGFSDAVSEVQLTFLKNGTKSLSKLASENLKNNRLQNGCLAGVDFWHPKGLHYVTQRTLWMSEMTPSNTPILKSLVLQIFWCDFGKWFCFILHKSHVYIDF